MVMDTNNPTNTNTEAEVPAEILDMWEASKVQELADTLVSSKIQEIMKNNRELNHPDDQSMEGNAYVTLRWPDGSLIHKPSDQPGTSASFYDPPILSLEPKPRSKRNQSQNRGQRRGSGRQESQRQSIQPPWKQNKSKIWSIISQFPDKKEPKGKSEKRKRSGDGDM